MSGDRRSAKGMAVVEKVDKASSAVPRLPTFCGAGQTT
jgi:hypothetical protein